jgi:hypothetical protein
MKLHDPSSKNVVRARWRGLLARACKLSLAEWASLMTATLALLWARVVLARVPANQLIETLRAASDGAPDEGPSAECDEWLVRTSWAVQSAAAHLPWRTDCLVRVVAADRLVRRKGLQPEFFLSAGKTQEDGFMAHAWLSCQGIEMTGGVNPELGTLIEPLEN